MKPAIIKILEFFGLFEPQAYPSENYEDLWGQPHEDGYGKGESYEYDSYQDDSYSNMNEVEEHLNMNRTYPPIPTQPAPDSKKVYSIEDLNTRFNIPKIPHMENSNIPTGSLCEVVIINIQEFNEVTRALEELSHQKLVVINLNCGLANERQRVLDVISGGTSIINGSAERVSESTFLFSPSSIKVTSNFNERNTSAGDTVQTTYQAWQKAS